MMFLYSDRFGCEMAMPNDRRLRFGALFLWLLVGLLVTAQQDEDIVKAAVVAVAFD